jgi:hypothetical protein
MRLILIPHLKTWLECHDRKTQAVENVCGDNAIASILTYLNKRSISLALEPPRRELILKDIPSLERS